MRIDELHDWQALMRPGDPLDLLVDFQRVRPPWMARAACRDHPEVDFFPDAPRRGTPPNVAPALAVCKRCPVSYQCLEFAEENGEAGGIWGGLAARQRRAKERGAGVGGLPEWGYEGAVRQAVATQVATGGSGAPERLEQLLRTGHGLVDAHAVSHGVHEGL
ncbi:MAG: WhiB family transcriptional regulator [Acidimicrobiales bacterium]